MKRYLLFVLALGLLLGTSGATMAGLLPVQVSVTPDGGHYRWTYAIVLPTDSQLRPGNYFTIFDFEGYIADSASAPDGWELTVQNVGPTPDFVTPADNPGIPNLSWKYTGPELMIDGQIGLGNFWALSEFGGETEAFFTAQTHRTSDGNLDTNITTTVVPVPAAVPEIPEPTTLLLAGIGLPLVGFARARRRKNCA